jgi:hypothetical protein
MPYDMHLMICKGALKNGLERPERFKKMSEKKLSDMRKADLTERQGR